MIRSRIISTAMILFAILIAGCQPDRDRPSTDANGQPPQGQADREPDSSATSHSEAKPSASEPPTSPDRDRLIESAERLAQSGDLPGAVAKLRSLLVRNPNDPEVIFRTASLHAEQGQLETAVELLDSIPTDHPDAGLPALGQSADWLLALGRHHDAERRYLKILDRAPQTAVAHRKLAHLYNRQGRRHEAAEHIDALCRQGNVRQDELHALIHLSDALYDDPSQQPAAGQVMYYPLGPAAEARRMFMQNRYQEAAKLLQPAVEAGDQPASIVAFFGRVAAEAQDDTQFTWWLSQVDDSAKQFAEYWAAVGLYLRSKNRHEEAARALLEAVDRDPTDFRSIGRLRSVMETLGRPAEARRWEQRWMKLRDITHQNNRIASSESADTEAMIRLASMLDEVGRALEAVLWKSIAAYHRGAPQQVMRQLQAELRQIVSDERGFPDRQTRLCEMDLEQYPLPRLDSLQGHSPVAARTDAPADRQPALARFENVAQQVGLEHAYQVASTPLDYGFSVYQSVGGAVAVLDYDHDGRPDFYFAQGGADPPDFVGEQTNVLYRTRGDRLSDVTKAASAGERRYSMGLSAGDWNQDGFPDLVVGNIGSNSLLINNGDGTFTREVLDNRDDKTLMTTSLAMADLTGDAVPDLFELNYLHDPAISRRPRKNDQGQVVESLMPKDFDPGLDRIIVNQNPAAPSFQEISESESAARAGLGVVVADFDHHPGNEVFVGNDVYANQLWKRSPADGTWTDTAMLDGCAFGSNGVKTASMGVAAGDFDRNGWLDLHVTNFQDESVSYYLNKGGSFQDRNIQFGLDATTKSVLGFGTQAVDYDNNGMLDLVVANGHIENAITIDAPFRQPAQLFCNLGDRFELTAVDDPSDYWNRNHLGRGLATVDWNRDGRTDVAVTHLGEISALLINRTDTDHHWLQLSLCGTSSERDAIGARVELVAGDDRYTEWVTAGDGFLSHNEPILSLGLADHTRVDEVTITWPSGDVQRLSDLAADTRWLIIEGQPNPFKLP